MERIKSPSTDINSFSSYLALLAKNETILSEQDLASIESIRSSANKILAHNGKECVKEKEDLNHQTIDLIVNEDISIVFDRCSGSIIEKNFSREKLLTSLSKRSSILLYELASRPGEKISLEELSERIWPCENGIEYFDIQRLGVLVSRTRIRLNKVSPLLVNKIKSVPRYGYKWIGQPSEG